LRIRASQRIASPVTVGSRIVLPDDYADWDTQKLRIVLAHEGSHVRQGDFYLQLCASIYTALFWFSPMGWWLKRKLSDLSETISDRAAVGHAASHASYAKVLLEFAALPRTSYSPYRAAAQREQLSAGFRRRTRAYCRRGIAGSDSLVRGNRAGARAGCPNSAATAGTAGCCACTCAGAYRAGSPWEGPEWSIGTACGCSGAARAAGRSRSSGCCAIPSLTACMG
jgi:hypothetical protein